MIGTAAVADVYSLAVGVSTSFVAVTPDSCVLVREYVGGAITAIPGSLLVGDVGLVIGVSLVVNPAQREMASCHLAASLYESALKAKSCFVNPFFFKKKKHKLRPPKHREPPLPLKYLLIPSQR